MIKKRTRKGRKIALGYINSYTSRQKKKETRHPPLLPFLSFLIAQSTWLTHLYQLINFFFFYISNPTNLTFLPTYLLTHLPIHLPLVRLLGRCCRPRVSFLASSAHCLCSGVAAATTGAAAGAVLEVGGSWAPGMDLGLLPYSPLLPRVM